MMTRCDEAINRIAVNSQYPIAGVSWIPVAMYEMPLIMRAQVGRAARARAGEGVSEAMELSNSSRAITN
jgi:hypothetical protein